MDENFFKQILQKIKYALLREIQVWGKDKNRIHLGKNVKVWNALFNVVSGHVYVGDDSFFGHNCMMLTGTHNWFDGKRARLSGKDEIPTEGNDIVIGKGCWIASGVIVIGGVKIGDNSIIGAGSVVTKDIPPGVFAAGNPAKVIRNLTDD